MEGQGEGVRWYLMFPISYRDLELMLLDRGLEVDHTTIFRWIKAYAAKHGIVYLDYYSVMVDDHGGMKRDLTGDGVHPNAAGYEVMAKLAEQAIAIAGKSGR